MEFLHFATITMTTVLVFSYELTVSNPTRCVEDKAVCVADIRDCGPRPPSSVLKHLNMSCSYNELQRSVSCEWSEDSDQPAGTNVSLIFRSHKEVISCLALLNPSAMLQITARIRRSDVEIWSESLEVKLREAMKPSTPELDAISSTEDSVVLLWRSSNSRCRLRYRTSASRTWTQVPHLASTGQNQKQNSTIHGLQPFTVYVAAVSCRQEVGVWSNWSASVSVRTLDRAPFRPPQVCSRLEKTDSGGLVVHLMWKALDPHEARGCVLGYQVSYRPGADLQLQDGHVLNVTEGVVALKVENGTWIITVAAFNTAGYGPPANLSVDTQRRKFLPSVRNVWVSSSPSADRSLEVQWTVPADPPPALPVRHIDVQWHPERDPSSSRWARLSGSSASLLIPDVDPDESYLIRVVTVHRHQCGAAQSLSANLQQGALQEPIRLHVICTNKTAVRVMWAWQQKPEPIRVSRYRVMLRSNADKRTQMLWLDQRQHTFLNLSPNTEYSLILLADDVSSVILPVRTDFDEVPVVATVTPVLLLAVIAVVVSILSRTVYKSFFFPRVSSPRDSKAGQWLMGPHPKNPADRHILDIRDFQDTDVLGLNSSIVVGPRCRVLQDDKALLPLDHLTIRLSDLRLDADNESGQRLRFDSVPWDWTREADPLLRQTQPQKEEEKRQLHRETSQRDGDAVKRCLQESGVTRGEGGSTEQAEGSVVCETDYIPNIGVLT